MAIFLVSIICLGGLFASPAEAAVKTYYAQQDGSCGSNSGSGLVWQSAAEGNSNCGSRSRIGGRDANGDFLIAVTLPYASETTITGQTGSNIYFQEAGRGVAIGEVQLVEVNATGNSILTYFSGQATRNYGSSSGSITDLSGLSGTVNAGNRLGMLVSVNNTDGGEINFYYGQSGGAASAQAWFKVDEVVANSAPTLTVNQPDGVGDAVDPGNSFSIDYDLSDSDDTVTVAFYYDTNNSGLNGTAITGACATALEGTGATCSWDTTGVTPGSYYVYGITNDGTNPQVSDYSSGTITINACSESITSSIIWNGTNSATGDFNGSSFITANDVNTLQYQVTEGGGPGTVSQITAWTRLYNGTGASGLTVGTPNITNGSANKMMFVYLATEGGNPTSTTVTYGGQSMTLAGSDLGSNNDSFVFWLNAADIDASANNNLVVTGSSQWSQLKVGYTVLDGVDQASPGTFASNFGTSGNTGPWTVPALNVGAGDLVITGINHQRPNADLNFSIAPAEFTLDLTDYASNNSLGAATRNNTNANASLSVSWSAGVTNGTHKSVWAMAVKAASGESIVIPWTGGPIPAIANLTDGDTYNLYASGTEAECSVDTYYGDPSVGNKTADGIAQSFTWTPAPPNSPPTLTVNEPNGVSDMVTQGASYNINYDLADSDDTVTAAFYYDTNNSGLDGTAISGACASAVEGTGVACSWNTTGVTPGTYYVYGITNDGTNPAVNDYSPGQITINAPNSPPTLTVNEPNGVSDTVSQGANYSINYNLADSDDVVTVAFYYDTNNSGLDGTAISGACASATEGAGVTCSWNTTGVTPGTYYVYGITNDGTNPQVDDYSPGQITINSIGGATLVVNQPDGTGDTIAEGGSFTVNYNLSDSNDVTTVAFFYDTNNSGADGNAIAGCAAEPEATGGTCTWNTSGVAPGNYYVYGTTSGDGEGATTVYSSGTMTINDAPALSISEPNGTGDTETAGSVYNITYTLTDSNDTITAAFYYDSDAANYDGTAITGACATAAEGSGVTCAWDTSGMAPGDYYVYGISTTDAFSSAAQAYSPGVITITPNSAATLVVTEPNGAGDTIAQGGSFTVNYNLSDSDNVTTVAFFYDTNNSGADGTAIGGCAAEPEATPGTCVWNTSGVAPSSYYVYGTTSGDGAGATTVYSSGTMTINASPFSYASGDDGTNPGGGDSIAGISRSGGGDDDNNYQSGKLKINVEYEFRIDFTDDSGENPQVKPELYLAHRDSPTEGAGGDFFVYPLVCTGVTWGTGKRCTTTMKLGPAASHKFYFYAEKTDGTVMRQPSSGYTDGPVIHLIRGYSLAGVARDIDSSSYDAYAAFNSYYSYSWFSAGLDVGETVNGNFVSVTSGDPAEAGRGYFIYNGGATLPQLGSNVDVTAASHTITLQAGWNLISNPYNGNVKLDDVQIRQNAGTTNTWSDAAGAGWIVPAVYYSLGSDWGETSTSEFGPEAELVPWMGYWMYIKDDINTYELIITKPAQ